MVVVVVMGAGAAAGQPAAGVTRHVVEPGDAGGLRVRAHTSSCPQADPPVCLLPCASCRAAPPGRRLCTCAASRSRHAVWCPHLGCCSRGGKRQRRHAVLASPCACPARRAPAPRARFPASALRWRPSRRLPCARCGVCMYIPCVRACVTRAGVPPSARTHVRTYAAPRSALALSGRLVPVWCLQVYVCVCVCQSVQVGVHAHKRLKVCKGKAAGKAEGTAGRARRHTALARPRARRWRLREPRPHAARRRRAVGYQRRGERRWRRAAPRESAPVVGTASWRTPRAQGAGGGRDREEARCTAGGPARRPSSGEGHSLQG